MKKKTNKKTLTNKKILSNKKYKKFIKLKQQGKLSKKNTLKLNKMLNKKYCKCIKRVKKTLKKNKGGEYPICTSSNYNKRNFKPPKNKNKNC